MNVFIQECKMNLKNTLLWIVVLCGLGGLLLSFYPIIHSDLENFMAVMDNFPAPMKAIMGIITENFKTAFGFYSFAQTFTMLFAGIQATNLGVGIVSKESREKTADFLLTKPISRMNILHAKTSASILLLAVTSITYSLIMYIVILSVSSDVVDIGTYLVVSLSFFLLQIIFFSIGLVVSVLAKKIKSVLPVTLGLIFFFYAISAFAITSESDKLRYLTPFQYFKPEYVIKNGSFENSYVVTGLIVFVVCVAASYAVFCKKDVHAV